MSPGLTPGTPTSTRVKPSWTLVIRITPGPFKSSDGVAVWGIRAALPHAATIRAILRTMAILSLKRCRLLRSGRVWGCVKGGKLEPERRARSRLAGEVDAPTVRLDDVACEREAEAGTCKTTCGRGAAKEPGEDATVHGARDPE